MRNSWLKPANGKRGEEWEEPGIELGTKSKAHHVDTTDNIVFRKLARNATRDDDDFEFILQTCSYFFCTSFCTTAIGCEERREYDNAASHRVSHHTNLK